MRVTVNSAQNNMIPTSCEIEILCNSLPRCCKQCGKNYKIVRIALRAKSAFVTRSPGKAEESIRVRVQIIYRICLWSAGPLKFSRIITPSKFNCLHFSPGVQSQSLAYRDLLGAESIRLSMSMSIRLCLITFSLI